MTKSVPKMISELKANFIINPVSETENSQDFYKINELYPHIEREYLKYIRHCKKNNINTFGTIQYVPVDIWALIFVDTIENDYIEAYDENYQYVVNVFCKENVDGEIRIDIETLKKTLNDIKKCSLASNMSIAIPAKLSNNQELHSFIQNELNHITTIELY